MKNIISLFVLLALAVPAISCDEACRKDQAEAKLGNKFPGYLNWKYCEGIKAEFMTVTIRSLQKYRDTRMDPSRKRGMKNTQIFIDQRKNWLLECDNYIAKTKQGRIFKERKTTDKIFAAMDSVSKELNSLARGVTYSTDTGQDSTAVVSEKFDRLFKLVDDHKTLLQLKNQFVSRDR